MVNGNLKRANFGNGEKLCAMLRKLHFGNCLGTAKATEKSKIKSQGQLTLHIHMPKEGAARWHRERVQLLEPSGLACHRRGGGDASLRSSCYS